MPKGLSPAARVMAFFSSVSLAEAEQMFDLVKETMKVRRAAGLQQASPVRRTRKKRLSPAPPVSEALPLGEKPVRRPRRTHAQMIEDALVPQGLPGG